MRTVIIPVKDRLHHLKASLPAVISQRSTGDFIIVVDYDCPNETANFVSEFFPEVQIVKLDDAPIFNLSHARNLGAKAAPPETEVLIFLDADSVPQPGWLDAVSVPITLGDFGLVHCGPGSCGVRKSLYEEVRGYDESFEGWGDESHDFWRRCEAIEPATTYTRNLLEVLGHSDKERTKHYIEQDIKKNQQNSSQHRRNKKRKVNPGGFGKHSHRADPEGRFNS